MNTFGQIFRVTTFGESHGQAIGGIIDGMPAGVSIDISKINQQLARRRPGQSDIVTARNESDTIHILSGMMDGITTGTPIGFTIDNTDHRSADYTAIQHAYRPSHADYTYSVKYGIRDYRGGGRSSARATACVVAAGAFAAQALTSVGMKIYAYTSQVGDVRLPHDYTHYDPSLIDINTVRCPDNDMGEQMLSLIRSVKAAGDTIGGVVTCVIKGCPAGLGEPIFGKLQARLAEAMLSINAAKGFDYGMGFDGVANRGSEMNDAFTLKDGGVHTTTNHSGGIQGGISNGEDIYFRVAFKPVATLMRDIDTIDDTGKAITLHATGRHDPCVVPRAVPIVESMASVVMLDTWLLHKTTHL